MATRKNNYFYKTYYNYHQVFLVAGGEMREFHDVRSSTETLVEGGQAWNFQNPLPSGRVGVRGISLPDTVIMTGKIVLTFTLNRRTKSFQIYLRFRIRDIFSADSS